MNEMEMNLEFSKCYGTMLQLNLLSPSVIIDSIKYNSKLKRVLGKCIRKGSTFSIEFNKSYFESSAVSKDAKLKTIYHELVHTIEGCFNHGEKFKSIGRTIERYTGISGVYNRTTATDVKYKEETYKYKIACTTCGNETFRHRTLKNVIGTKVTGYRCGKCSSPTLTQIPLR
jgi:predicted SprT family Zn-dependent metalloprotease